MRTLLSLLAASHPLLLSEKALEDDFPALYEALRKSNFLKQAEPSKEAECPATPNGSYHIVFPHNGKLAVNCDCQEGVGIAEVDRKTVIRWEVSLASLLGWIADELKLTKDFQPSDGGAIWLVGTKEQGGQTFHFYFLRTDKIAHATDMLGRLQKPNPIAFWLGDTPHTGYVPANLISLAEELTLKKSALSFNPAAIKKMFPKGQHTKTGDIELDTHIVLRQESEEIHYLLLVQEEKRYQHKERIRPQASRMIRLVYDLRTYKDNTHSLDDFVVRDMVKEKRTASTRIKEINTLCSDYEVKPIFHKFHDDKWGLNPDLDCCQ
jgi:hypothetical protein